MPNRKHQYEIMNEIVDRWSPRAFDATQSLTQEQIHALIEAAHFAPSCFNEQPWRFVIGNEPQTKGKILSTLAEFNQQWAKDASALLVVLAKKTFTENGNVNAWSHFDVGAAWAMLSLEATRRGLITHAMAGFNAQAVRTELNICADFDVVAIVAVGFLASPDTLPEPLRQRERPSPRKPISELILEG